MADILMRSIRSMKAICDSNREWLQIHDAAGSCVSVPMQFEKAQALALVWEQMQITADLDPAAVRATMGDT